MIAVQNKGKSPTKFRFVKKISITQTIPIFIAKPKSPRVIILKGRVIKLRIGLIKAFIKPNKNPANNKSLINPVNSMPGTNSLANQSAIIPAMICRINFLKRDFIDCLIINNTRNDTKVQVILQLNNLFFLNLR